MSEIEDVSDTALWVAYYRAEEGKRPNALFQDPLAEKLVGDRGRKIAESMPHGKVMQWVMTVRTVALDRLVLEAIAEGVDTVVNLGAGLDTRPYRMELPATLRWIEVDFPNMIQLKNERLSADKPVCQLERMPLDLSDRPASQKLLQEIASRSKKILAITEGVIYYLSNDEAAALADDLHALSQYRFWIQDFQDAGLAKRVPSALRKRMQNAPMKFSAPRWLEFFRQHGWAQKTVISTMEEARRIGRPIPIPFITRLLMRFTSRFSYFSRDSAGFVLLERK